MYKQRKILNV